MFSWKYNTQVRFIFKLQSQAVSEVRRQEMYCLTHSEQQVKALRDKKNSFEVLGNNKKQPFEIFECKWATNLQIL